MRFFKRNVHWIQWWNILHTYHKVRWVKNYESYFLIGLSIIIGLKLKVQEIAAKLKKKKISLELLRKVKKIGEQGEDYISAFIRWTF